MTCENVRSGLRFLALSIIIRRFLDPLKPLVRASLGKGAVARLRPAYRWLQDRRIAREPDRRFLSGVILPAMADEGASRVLFVGTRSYTMAALAQMGALGMEVWSTDIDPDAARYGVPGRHRTLDIALIDSDTFPVVFDAVLMNGVLGYGVNTPRQCMAALAGVFRVLRSGGRLVLGWNWDRCPDVPDLARGQGFRWDALATQPEQVTFAGSTHRYDFLRRD